jgi:hypothetical protein
MFIGPHINYPLFLSYFNEIWISSIAFQKILKYQISWKSFQGEPSCSMRTDGRTGINDEVISPFLQFCEHAYNWLRTNIYTQWLIGAIDW